MPEKDLIQEINRMRLNDKPTKPTPISALIPPMPAPKHDKSEMLNVSLNESNIIHF